MYLMPFSSDTVVLVAQLNHMTDIITDYQEEVPQNTTAAADSRPCALGLELQCLITRLDPLVVLANQAEVRGACHVDLPHLWINEESLVHITNATWVSQPKRGCTTLIPASIASHLVRLCDWEIGSHLGRLCDWEIGRHAGGAQQESGRSDATHKALAWRGIWSRQHEKASRASSCSPTSIKHSPSLQKASGWAWFRVRAFS